MRTRGEVFKGLKPKKAIFSKGNARRGIRSRVLDIASVKIPGSMPIGPDYSYILQLHTTWAVSGAAWVTHRLVAWVFNLLLKILK